jgi:tRNA-specific adenosine deaminase
MVISMNEKYMMLAINEAKKAYKKNEVPIGCVIIKDGRIISKAHNKKEIKKNAIMHAEIIAIAKACKKLKTWHLDDCVLYTTVEPCMMCTGAIIQSRIKKIYYSISNKSFGELENYHLKNKKIFIQNNILNEESKKLLQQFFKEKRKL